MMMKRKKRVMMMMKRCRCICLVYGVLMLLRGCFVLYYYFDTEKFENRMRILPFIVSFAYKIDRRIRRKLYIIIRRL